MKEIYELWAGPADGETGDIQGRVPAKLVRRGGGRSITEYVLNPKFNSDTIAQYVPVELLASKKEAAGDVGE